MARRGRKAPRRRRKSFSITNALFSLGFANIISQGVFKTNIMTFFLEGTGLGVGSSGGGISLTELISRPDTTWSASNRKRSEEPSTNGSSRASGSQ